MNDLLQTVLNPRLLALIRKEFNQIRRDRRLAISLILPPVVQLGLFGFALSAAVSHIRLGVVDDSQTPQSRELVATLTQSKSFQSAGYYLSVNELGKALSEGKIDAGMAVPYNYARNLARGQSTTLQFLLNATNANTAMIAKGYAQGVIQTYNAQLGRQGLHLSTKQIAGARTGSRGQVLLRPAFLYNPGLVDSWFIVTGFLVCCFI